MSTTEHFSNDIPGPSTGQMPNPNARSTPRQPYQFTDDELRVLRECNRDSFFQRCLPIGTGMGMAAWFGVKNGYLRPSVRYGATPKVVVSVIIGYFLGKLSYQTKCAEKLMTLPDSKLGSVLRQRKYGGNNLSIQESLDSLMPYSSPSDIYSDDNAKPSDKINIDTTRPEQAELDDTHRPTLDNQIFEEDVPMPPMQKKATSYDELRKMNREQQQKGRTANYNRETPASADLPISRRIASSPSDPNVPKITNKYGDLME